MAPTVFPSPLVGYDTSTPLPEGFKSDGKSLMNLESQQPRSKAYEAFPAPIRNGGDGLDFYGFDFHIYWFQNNPKQDTFARELHERIRREFPELRIKQLHPYPLGPHITAMFEVDVYSPLELGAFFAWIVVNRGPLSVLVHPNTGDGKKDQLPDHRERACWIGPKIELDFGRLEDYVAMIEAEEQAEKEKVK